MTVAPEKTTEKEDKPVPCSFCCLSCLISAPKWCLPCFCCCLDEEKPEEPVTVPPKEQEPQTVQPGVEPTENPPNPSTPVNSRKTTVILQRDSITVPPQVPLEHRTSTVSSKVRQFKQELEIKAFEAEIKNIMDTPVPKTFVPVVPDDDSTTEEEEMEEDGITHLPFNRTLSTTSNASSIFRDAKLDASFRRKREAQETLHAEKLKIIREEREKINRGAEELANQMNQKSAEDIKILFNFINLKLRWEEQENQWNQSLTEIRKPIQKVKNQFFEFQGKSYRMLKSDFPDEGELREEFIKYQKHVLSAYDTSIEAFKKLENMREEFNDEKLFIRILQSRISQVATNLAKLIKAIDDFQDTSETFNNISVCESSIDSHYIPTAGNLRELSKNAKPENYENIPEPMELEGTRPIILEILDDD